MPYRKILIANYEKIIIFICKNWRRNSGGIVCATLWNWWKDDVNSIIHVINMIHMHILLTILAYHIGSCGWVCLL